MAASPNPYTALPPTAFWKSAVAGRSPFDIAEIWTPRFPIGGDDRIVTFGSCFAQHIGRALRENDAGWHDAEPGPDQLTPEQARTFNYGVFSARTGNIYTTAMLLQWTRWALKLAPAPKEGWEADGRHFDPVRPTIEPNGFASREELLLSRNRTIEMVRECITTADVLVFTLGLTEAWVNDRTGLEYALCPGTAAGTFDAKAHRFVNHDYPAVLADLEQALDLMREANPTLRVILTVSPVPLTASASDAHVLTATMASKSILRAVAGSVAAKRDHVDYFPAYELIASPALRGMFFTPNQRGIAQAGVDFVMHHFFAGIAASAITGLAALGLGAPAETRDAAWQQACDEELLEAFAQ